MSNCVAALCTLDCLCPNSEQSDIRVRQGRVSIGRRAKFRPQGRRSQNLAGYFRVLRGGMEMSDQQERKGTLYRYATIGVPTDGMKRLYLDVAH